MAPRKRKDEDEEEDDVPKKPARSTKKAKKLEGPSVGADGWTTHPPSVIYKMNETTGYSKVAAFDFDGTLAKTKSGAAFATNAEDWRLSNPGVPKHLQELHKDGFKIVLFTNQGAIKSALTGKAAEKIKARITQVVEVLKVPVAAIFMATLVDEFRKPQTGMWTLFCEQITDDVKPDLGKSFYVGDAAGRPTDFADSDKEFANQVGLKFKTPEECWGKSPNADLCACFDQLAEHWKKEGEHFKSSAFRKVSAALGAMDEDVKSGKQAGALPGVGKASSALIDEWLTTGKMQALEDIKGESGKAAEGAKSSEGGGKKHEALAFL